MPSTGETAPADLAATAARWLSANPSEGAP